MTLEQLQKIKRWNLLRDNNTFNPELERDMLHEEINEFYTEYNAFTVDGKLTLDRLTKMADAIADVNFVLGGTMHKFSASSKVNAYELTQYAALLQYAQHELMMMTQLLNDIVPFAGLDLDYCLSLVIEANEQKSTTRNAAGKITKPDGFIPPDQRIKEYLISLDKESTLSKE